MIKINLTTTSENQRDFAVEDIHLPFHETFYDVYQKLYRWQRRFPFHRDERIFNNQTLFYSLATKRLLDHRSPSHLAKLLLSIHFMHKTLQRHLASSPLARQLEIKWIPTQLTFPFSSKSVLGCLIGFNLIDRYELFDEENIFLLLKKNHLDCKIVQESFYSHLLSNKKLKIIYFEIERKDGNFFSTEEKRNLERNLDRQIKASFQKLTPAVFMRRNEEEVHKTILTLSREICSVEDIPQAWISFEHQTQKEIVFLALLVNVAKSGSSIYQSLAKIKDHIFVPERTITVRHLQDSHVEAHIFRLHLLRNLTFIRSDGSLDFYASRQYAASLIQSAIGEFRDFNGGGLIKQHELLEEFKKHFPKVVEKESELMETFFYALTPLEKQTILPCHILNKLFSHFLDHRNTTLQKETPYLLDITKKEQDTYIAFKGNGSNWKDPLEEVVNHSNKSSPGLTYTFLDHPDGLFFNAVITNHKRSASIVEHLKKVLQAHYRAIKKRQVLRIGLEYALVSLDPRIGGDSYSSETLRLLFEGLTRFNKSGAIEMGIAESIKISEDRKKYTFTLRNSIWNNGTALTAHDFEYSWKKVLSPDFDTAFAYLFYPIKYAKEAKEGKIDLSEIGVSAVDDRTLQVELTHPTPYFLELTTQLLYCPVSRHVDQKHPQWPYQSENNYPCNGPFQIAVNDPTLQTYKLIKNPNYWDKKSITLDEVMLTQVDPNQALHVFKNGEIDWIGNPFGGWHPFFNTLEVGKKITIPSTSACWLIFNTTHTPFHHDKIRQAFGYAIDRLDLISESFIPLIPAFSPLIHPTTKRPDALFPSQNLEKSLQLLHDGCKELGISKQDLCSMQLVFHKGGIREETALKLRQQLFDLLGIDCQLKGYSNWNALFSKMTSGDFQMSLLYIISKLRDPASTLSTFRYAQEDINFSKWEDPLYQHWLYLSDQETDAEERKNLLRCAEEKLCQKMPIIPLFYQPFQSWVQNNLKVVSNHSYDLARSYFMANE